jgi:hypothetical protein
MSIDETIAYYSLSHGKIYQSFVACPQIHQGYVMDVVTMLVRAACNNHFAVEGRDWPPQDRDGGVLRQPLVHLEEKGKNVNVATFCEPDSCVMNAWLPLGVLSKDSFRQWKLFLPTLIHSHDDCASPGVSWEVDHLNATALDL